MPKPSNHPGQQIQSTLNISEDIMETNILAHQIHGVSVGMQKADGYVNATKACEAYKVATGKTKRTENWTRSARAKAYIAYVASVTRKSVTELVLVRKGGTPEEQGTWIHPDLAIAFGTWLSVEFEYQLTQWVKEWESSQRPPINIDPDQPSPHEIESVLQATFGEVVEPARLAIVKSSAIVGVHPEWSAIMSEGLDALPSLPPEEQTYTPTELGQLLEPKLSAIRVNKLLEAAGYQESYRTARNVLKWKPIDKAGDLAVITLEEKSNGKPIESLRWKHSVVDVLLSLVADSEQAKVG
ncbi:KilA-N domain-containing protein [Acaryochloris marina]|uniref:KilA-N domain-containing protein n=1 Tax=Acaryochloris marina TaxID=155978 RepID=UPI000674A3A4|nr:KilA-N domain-containing protein [Acaryochloris marina]